MGTMDRVGAALCKWRPPSGADEDRNREVPRLVLVRTGVASALRGGRGSQHADHDRRQRAQRGGVRPPGRTRIATARGTGWTPGQTRWRPPSGADEDRNAIARSAFATWSALWRPPSGADEDRNDWPPQNGTGGGVWRPPSGADEDRNLALGELAAVVDGHVASALRGGRGSQLVPVLLPHPPAGGGVRPPGRTRIATRSASRPWTCRRRRRRPPSGADEDRNSIAATITSASKSVASALRGGRGSQRAGRADQRLAADRGVRPPGRTRIATGRCPGVPLTRASGGVRPPGRTRIATTSEPAGTRWPSGVRPPGRTRIATPSVAAIPR